MAKVDEIIGTPGEVDWYTYPLIGQVDYVITALGASNGNTLLDPAVFVFDSAGNFITSGDDSWVLGEDPMLQFKAPYSDTYSIAVLDMANSTGSYTLIVDQAGVPIFLAGFPGT